MGGVKKCAVCKRSEKIPGVRLFSFPRQKYRCDQWLQNIGDPDLYKFSTYRLSVAYKVCEQHFERNCFFSDMLNRLVRGAVPTLFGPNVKQHVSIDTSLLKNQQNKHSVVKLQKFNDRHHVSEIYDKSSGRIPESIISVSVIDELEDSLLLQEDVTCADNSLSKCDEINCSSNEISQHDLSQLNTMSVGISKFEHTGDNQIPTHEKLSMQIVDKMSLSECRQPEPCANVHVAYPCSTENNSSPVSDSEEVSVEGFVQEGFLHNWMVDDSVLNEDDNTTILFGNMCEQMSNKKDFVQDIGEVDDSFNEVSETVAVEERSLEEGQFSDYMDVSSMHVLDQSEFLPNWLPVSNIVDNKMSIANERLDDRALSDIAIDLMGEGRGHEKTNSVKDITVCNWKSENVSGNLTKLSNENYEGLGVCDQQDNSEPAHLESIFLPEFCEEASSISIASSDEIPICDSLCIQTINEDLFQSQKFSNKRVANLSNASKENLQKPFKCTGDVGDFEDIAVTSATISLLPIQLSFDKGFQTVQVMQPEGGEKSEKLCQVTYMSESSVSIETDTNSALKFCNTPRKSLGNELNQNIASCNYLINGSENVASFQHIKNTSVDLTQSEAESDSTNYMVYNFESICRLCLATDEVMYPIFSDSNSLAEKDVVSCIPVKVKKDDKYPKFICKKCYEQMASWLKFKEFCFKTQSVLEQLTSSLNLDCTGSEKQEGNLSTSSPVEYAQEKRKIISRSTQTVPMAELILGKGPLVNEPRMAQQNKENDLICQKLKRRQLVVHKKRTSCDMKIRRVREIPSSKRKLNRGKNCIGIESSSCSSTIPSSQGVTQNKVANIMKQLHFSGLKPGCHLTVADKKYLIVGKKSGSKSGVGLYTKQQFCSETGAKHICKT